MMERQYIGRYRITGKLGRGGMGTVVQAMDEVRNRPVAIKLPNDLDPDAIQRLKQECEVVTRLEHANIVQVYGSGSDPDLPFYIVMEFVQGRTVEGLLREQAGRPLEPQRALKIALGVAEALAYAHKPPLRVIHRDIKPGNVLIRQSDEAVKVTDFGIAAVLAEKTGRTAVGTLAYMAPEQAMGQGVDARTDIYSLGAMLYEMLTGQRPPQIAASQPSAPSGSLGAMMMSPDISQRVDRLVLGMLRRDPNQRIPQNAADLVEELRAILEGRPTRILSAPSPSSGGVYDPSRPANPSQAIRTRGPVAPSIVPPSGYTNYPAPGAAPHPPAYPMPYPSPYPPQAPVIVNVHQQVQQPLMVQPVVPVVPMVQVFIRPSSAKASTALTLAILSIFFLGPILAVPAIITGHAALNEIKANGGQLDGHGQAVAALVIGYLITALGLLILLLILASPR